MRIPHKTPSVVFVGLAAAFTLVNLVGPRSAVAQQITAFKTGERETGMTKQCVYEALGSEYTRTVSAVALCPLRICEIITA